MKKVFLTFVFVLSLVILNSCEKNKNAEIIEEEPLAVNIESEETPDLDRFYFLKGKTSFSFSYDESRIAKLNQNINQLIIPVKEVNDASWLNLSDFDSDRINVASSFSGKVVDAIVICIARTKPKDGCTSCVNCLGFRCSGCTKSISKNDSFINNSQSRQQLAQVTYDEDTNELIYQFINEVDWEYMKKGDE